MGANFDLELLCQTCIPIEALWELLDVFGKKLSVKAAKAYPNWSLSSEDERLIDIHSAPQFIKNEQIICADALLGNENAGVLAFQCSDLFSYTLWVDTAIYPELDSDDISEHTSRIYDAITTQLCLPQLQNRFLTAALGCETTISCNGNIREMIQSSHNVIRWICRTDLDIQSINGYLSEKTIQNYAVFTKLPSQRHPSLL